MAKEFLLPKDNPEATGSFSLGRKEGSTIGANSFVAGTNNIASGYASHAEGEYTNASGVGSHAEGWGTIATSSNQHVQGKFNIEDSNNQYVNIVGGGIDNKNRKNISTLDWDGNAEFAGNVTAHDIEGNALSMTSLNTRIDTAENIAKGRNQAHVFSTITEMQLWLSNIKNRGKYNVGDNIYIVEIDVPDWWVAEVLETADAITGYYYKISQLETQKVDLTEYDNHIQNKANPHEVTKAQIGLENGCNSIVLSREEYDQLTEEQKNDGTVYYVTGESEIGSANQIDYDNTISKLTATNVQSAIDENAGMITKLNSTFVNNAAAHNGIFRGKDLTNIYTIDQICQRISNGTFEDLYIGDYFDITISTSYTSSEVVRCILAGFDIYWYNGDTAFSKHHAVIVPKNCFTALASMNSTNTTVGAFIGSAMWTTVLPIYTEAFKTILGNHLLMHRTLLTNTMNADLNSNAGVGLKGASSNWAWTDTYLSLLSEIQVYGSNVCSSSFYDTGCDNLQLPLFVLDPTAKICGKGGTASGGRMWYWLKNVASSAYFADANSGGNSDCYGAASYAGGVRPVFCVG